jgi:hypothetical protein
MARNRSASNVLEFLVATLVMSCLLGMVIPVAYKVNAASENIRYAKQLKEIDSGSMHSKVKNSNSKY